MNKLKKLKFIGKDTQLKIFLVLAIIVVLIAIFAPVIVPKDPFKQLGPSLQRPSNRFIFGTDHLGRDLFSRIIYGSRYSIFMTLTLMFVIFAVGTILGVIAGYFGGIVDTVIMRIGDMMIAFPGLILAIAIAMSAKYIRQIRHIFLEELGKSYVTGARMRGIKERDILWKHVLPNAMLPIITLLGLSLGSLLGGTAVVEIVYNWPGMGKMAVKAISSQDYPLIQAYVLIIAFLYLIVNITVDISYKYLDARVEEVI